MKSAVRVLSFFLVLATVYWVMTQGAGVMSKAIETTRKLVAMWNLRTIKDVVLVSRVLQEPDRILNWTDEDFSDFLKEHLSHHGDSGSDPSTDPWEVPYMLESLDDEGGWVLYSAGPNLEPDLCDFEGPGGDDICLLIEAAEISH